MDRGQAGEESLEPRQSNDMEVRNAVATRKVMKADREKLRRGKLNEQLLELGTLLDPERPKNDKGSIISDTIQVLKDLNSEVKKLKAEHAVLCEESRELTQEKNELREEKASLKSNIQNLKVQQQHQPTQGFMVPWATVDSPMLMAPSYPFPVAVPVHRTTQPCSTFIPYLAPVIPRVDHSAALNTSTSYISGPGASSSRSFRTGNSNEVATDLELKMPGSTSTKELSTREKGKQAERHQEKSATNGSSLTKSSSKDENI
ncbi:hypothetical protein C2S52_009498 [Perilla frutescens var. hirtella]|nr:hypothetical protein C2S51_017016 [Perilla frutescens var. frutescens]KAH6784539.1 hypothetical protein C2S52_009498 [Perilla frutescens var. hirtella]